MPVIHISAAPDREQYDAVRKHIELESLREVGLIWHSASELPSGEVRIVDVYEDDDARERASARVLAAFTEAGLAEMMARGPQPEVSSTFEVVR